MFNRAKVDPTGAASYATTPKEWIQQGIDKQNAESTRIAAVASQTNAATQALQQQMGPVDAVNAIMGNSSILDNGSAAIQQLRDSNGNLPAGYAGVTGENLKQKILSDPKLTAIAGSIEAAKKLGQTIDYSGGFEGVQQQLRLISQTGKDAAYRINKTQDAAGRSIAGGAPITPTAPTAGTVPTIRIQMPDGRTGTIPATSWGKYMAMGATKVTQ